MKYFDHPKTSIGGSLIALLTAALPFVPPQYQVPAATAVAILTGILGYQARDPEKK